MTEKTLEERIEDIDTELRKLSLVDFIADQESRYFRTASDTGANGNALFVWNRLRSYAGLPKLTEDDLAAKEPAVGRFSELKRQWDAKWYREHYYQTAEKDAAWREYVMSLPVEES